MTDKLTKRRKKKKRWYPAQQKDNEPGPEPECEKKSEYSDLPRLAVEGPQTQPSKEQKTLIIRALLATKAVRIIAIILMAFVATRYL